MINSKSTVWDVIIIGAGPAGLMAAINAARFSDRVLVLDGQDRAGKKLLITGGGRCNISSPKITERDYQSGALRAVRNVISALPFRAVERFFSERGVAFMEEEGKLFPASGSARTVLETLLAAAGTAGARFEFFRKVTVLTPLNSAFSVSGAGFSHECRAAVLATGGLSYPETGSDGSGYAMARSVGHHIVPTTPALVPLYLDDPLWHSLAGITLPAGFSLVKGGRIVAASSGPLLFTHSGISGPGVMDLSRHWIRREDEKGTILRVNFLPAQKPGGFLEEIARTASEQPALSMKKTLARYFPERLAEVLLLKCGLDPKGQLAHCSKKDRLELAAAVFTLPVEVSRAAGYDKAEVTAGGVNMGEVNPKTLESRKCPGIFFAGEVLDVDGRIGGFNLHWAWASGHVAGEAAAKYSAKDPCRA